MEHGSNCCVNERMINEMSLIMVDDSMLVIFEVGCMRNWDLCRRTFQTKILACRKSTLTGCEVTNGKCLNRYRGSFLTL